MVMERFRAEGVVRLPGVLAGAAVAAMRGEVERMLDGMSLVEIAGARRPGPEAGEALWRVGKGSAFGSLAATVGAAVDRVFGRGIWEPVAAERGSSVRWRAVLHQVGWTDRRQRRHLSELRHVSPLSPALAA